MSNPPQEQNVPKNAVRLAEFESRISSLDIKADSVLGTLTVDVQKIQELKEKLTQMEADAKTKLENSNNQIDEQVKQKFKNDITTAENLIAMQNETSETLQQEIDEMKKRIAEYETKSNERIIIYRRKVKELEELNQREQLLKENVDEAEKENKSLRIDIDNRTKKIAELDVDVEELKKVIARLVDARLVLNKYFSSHYENFTEEEKRLIAEIEGNVFPKEYTNNPVLADDLPNVNDNINKINSMNNMMNVNNNVINKNNNVRQQNNEEVVNNLMNNQPSMRYEQQQKNINQIMNEDEYKEYQQRLANNGQGMKGESSTKKYFGPDDDYWYEINKKK